MAHAKSGQVGGLVVAVAVALLIAPGSAGDNAVAQDGEVLLGPMHGKTFKTLAEAPKEACQQLSARWGKWNGATVGPRTRDCCPWGWWRRRGRSRSPFRERPIALGSLWERLRGARIELLRCAVRDGHLGRCRSERDHLGGCDTERAGAQLFAFVWDKDTGDVVAARPVPWPEVEKPTLDHDGCSAQRPSVGSLPSWRDLEGVAKDLKLGAHTISLEKSRQNGDIVGADDLLAQLSSWPAVQRISKQGYEFSLEEPVRWRAARATEWVWPVRLRPFAHQCRHRRRLCHRPVRGR